MKENNINMKFLKDEKGITKVQLTLVVIVIMIIVAFSISLMIGEDGFSLETKDDENKNNTVTNEVIDNTVYR